MEPLFIPEWLPLLRKRITWQVELFIWSLPVDPGRLSEVRAEQILAKSLQESQD